MDPSNPLQQQPANVPTPVPSPSSAVHRWAFLWSGIATLLVAMGIVVWILSQHPAAATTPTMTWSTPSLGLTLSPGDTATQTLTLTSNATIKNVQLEAVPALTPFLTIQPSSFATLPANQPQTVRVSFKIPSGATLGTYDGTIHVRQGSLTLPNTLKLVLNVWQALSDPSTGFHFLLPPNWSSTFGADQAVIRSPALQGAQVSGEDDVQPADIIVKTRSNPSHLSLDDFVVAYAGTWYASYPTKISTSISGRVALEFSDLNVAVPQSPLIAVFISGNDSVIEISFDPLVNDSASLQVFTSFLSTFSVF